MINGLTDAQVRQQIEAGNVNIVPDQSAKSVKEIILSNVFTYFNIIFAVLGVLVAITGSFRNLTFLPVVVVNAVIGIVQQLKAKSVLDKLSLLAASEYKVIRNGKEVTVHADDLVLGDIIILEGGKQIPADAVLVEGKLMVSEALLTGEADEIEKTANSELRSGSFVAAGRCYARLTHVGKDSYAAKLMKQAKEIKDKKSEMVNGIDTIVKVAGIVIIPIGIALFCQSFIVNHNSFTESILSMVGAVVGMIPEGLYLLVTAALTLSALRLARSKVLLHDMRSTETLARVDILCVDKTGTITDNKMTVTETFAPDGGTVGNDVKQLFARYISTITDNNITMTALRDFFGGASALLYEQMMPFSSKQKFSQIITSDTVYRLGAPEFVLDGGTCEQYRQAMDERAQSGLRVIVFAKSETENGPFAPIMFVSIKNNLRPNVEQTFNYFKEQEVGIRVISGDNPVTVSNIAKSAGIENADKYVDMSLVEDKDIADAASKYTIFGRVKPEQKKKLILAFRAQGNKVAMTGDGVNDILAMKEADCSIAMGAGSEAAMQAAQVVLLDSDFSRMVDIISEGRRDINNITRSAVLFLFKNIFSLLLALFSILTAITYPLSPSQISLISAFNIGIPGFLLALEANIKKQKGRFMKEVVVKSIPAALASFAAIASMVLLGKLFNLSASDIGVASTCLLAIGGFILLLNISRPQNRYRIIVIAISIAGIVITALCFSDLFEIHMVSTQMLILGILFVLAVESVMRNLTRLFEHIHNPFKTPAKAPSKVSVITGTKAPTQTAVTAPEPTNENTSNQ